MNESPKTRTTLTHGRFLLLSGLIALVSSVIAINVYAAQAGLVTPESLVYKVCNEARISPVIDERGCGDLQDSTHTEFLCASRDRLASTHCWVEDKGKED